MIMMATVIMRMMMQKQSSNCLVQDEAEFRVLQSIGFRVRVRFELDSICLWPRISMCPS